MLEKFEIADTVLIKVSEIEMAELKNFLAINRNLPDGVPKTWGHKFTKHIHRYALAKDVKHKIYVIFSQRIGTIKKVYPIISDISNSSRIANSTLHQKYDVLWQERLESNREKGLGRHN